MTKHTFHLTVDNAFIPLDKLLKLCGAVASGGEAHQVIMEGLVKVNGAVERQKRKKLRAGDVVVFEDVELKVEQAE